MPETHRGSDLGARARRIGVLEKPIDKVRSDQDDYIWIVEPQLSNKWSSYSKSSSSRYPAFFVEGGVYSCIQHLTQDAIPWTHLYDWKSTQVGTTKVGISQALCGMRNSFHFYGILWRPFECVFRLYKILRRRAGCITTRPTREKRRKTVQHLGVGRRGIESFCFCFRYIWRKLSVREQLLRGRSIARLCMSRPCKCSLRTLYVKYGNTGRLLCSPTLTWVLYTGSTVVQDLWHAEKSCAVSPSKEVCIGILEGSESLWQQPPPGPWWISRLYL